MTDHYNWAFPQRLDTMYMSTIGTLKFEVENKPNIMKISHRESSFRMRDI